MMLFILGIFLFSIVPSEVVARNDLSNNNMNTYAQANIKTKQNMNQEAIRNYNMVKNRYQTVAGEWNIASSDFKVIKKKINGFNGLSSEDQEQVIEKTRTFLLKTADRMIAHLDIVEAWANKIDISDERRDSIMESISDYKEKLELLKSEVEVAEDLQTLRELSKDIKTSWGQFMPEVKSVSGELLISRIDEVVGRSEELYNYLKEKVDDLDQNDEEVQKMQTYLDNFQEKIGLTKERLEKAREIHQNMGEDYEARYLEMKGYITEAKTYLSEAHGILRSLVQAYRDYVGEVPVKDPVEVYPEIEENV